MLDESSKLTKDVGRASPHIADLRPRAAQHSGGPREPCSHRYCLRRDSIMKQKVNFYRFHNDGLWKL